MSDTMPTLALVPSVTQASTNGASLLARASGLKSNASPEKIKRSAQEFESILLTQWLEQAREAFASMPGGDEDDNDDPGHSQMMGLGMQALASAVTKSGGIGIARMLEHYLQKQSGQPSLPVGEK